MRRLVGLVVVVLGCGEKADDTGAEATCESGQATVVGMMLDANVPGDPVPMEGAAIYVWGSEVSTTPALELRSAADGSFTVDLDPGTWSFTAEELGVGCFTSEAVTVSVEACDQEELTLTMDVWTG